MRFRSRGVVSAIFLMAAAFLAINAQYVRASGVLILGPSTRAYGMGLSGTADVSDPSNAFYNPANISFINGAYLTGFYSKLVPDLADDVYTGNLAVAGGTRFRLGESYELGLGGCLRYQKLDYGEWGTFSGGTASSSEYVISFSLAGGIKINKIFNLGIGLSVKPVKLDLAPAWSTPDGESRESDGTASDFGILLGAELPIGEEFTFSGNIGLSYLNMGSDFEFQNWFGTISMPSATRYGIGIRLESQPLTGNEKFGPLFTLAFNVDKLDHTSEADKGKSDESSYGAEIGFLRMLFLRIGRWKYESGNIDDKTFGVGLGVELESFLIRLDWARVPQASNLDNVNKFGLITGISF